MKALTLLASLFLAGCQSSGEASLPKAIIAAPSAPENPNILLIVVDDVGFSDIGTYGSEIPTPNIDKIANNGVKFTNFHTGMTCSPTRAMLLTGVDHHLAGLGAMAEDLAPNQMGRPGYEGYLNDSVAPLPSILQDHGYWTVMAGKWHLGEGKGRGPNARGFDRSFVLAPGGAGHFSNMLPLVGPGRAGYFEDDRPLSQLPDNFYSTKTYTDRLIGYIDEGRRSDKARPFFAYLAYTAVHFPVQAPAESIAKFSGNYDDGYDKLFEQRLASGKRLGVIPSAATGAPRSVDGREWSQLSEKEQSAEAKRMEVYAAMLSDVDEQIGRLLDHLRSIGELENTVIMLMSDNGYEGHDLRHSFPEAAEWANKCCDNSVENIGNANSFVWMGPDWSRASTPAFRFYKGFPTEGGTRVPFIVNFSGLKKRGMVDDFAHVIDITPTILDLAHITPPRGTYRGHSIHSMSGRSMVPFLQSLSATIHDPDEPFAQELFGKKAIRIGALKAVQIPSPYGSGKWELFDLQTDLAEANNLSYKHPDELARLIAAWNVWASENNVIIPNIHSKY
jgi:arylsulfatase